MARIGQWVTRSDRVQWSILGKVWGSDTQELGPGCLYQQAGAISEVSQSVGSLRYFCDMRAQIYLLLGLLLVQGYSCTSQRVEGSEPNDCSDAADNDLDGLFDCADPDCAISPACGEGDDDDSGRALGDCRPVDHIWDPATEPMRLPCQRTVEPCNLIDDDMDGFLDPKCGTVSCSASAECTLGGLMPDADCHQNNPEGPVCTWIDGAPPSDDLLLCRGVLCPPGLKCFAGDCIVPGNGQPYSDCSSGEQCPINAGCLPKTEEGNDATCTWFCQDFPCPADFTCNEKVFTNTWTGDTVTHLICEPEGLDPNQEGGSQGCRPESCPECEDGIDNDNDGTIDCKDPSCSDWCGSG